MNKKKPQTKILKSQLSEKERINAENKGFEDCLRENVKNLSKLLKMIEAQDLDPYEYMGLYVDKLKEELEKYSVELH